MGGVSSSREVPASAFASDRRSIYCPQPIGCRLSTLRRREAASHRVRHQCKSYKPYRGCPTRVPNHRYYVTPQSSRRSVCDRPSRIHRSTARTPAHRVVARQTCTLRESPRVREAPYWVPTEVAALLHSPRAPAFGFRLPVAALVVSLAQSWPDLSRHQTALLKQGHFQGRSTMCQYQTRPLVPNQRQQRRQERR